jgi:hypothetical protein
MTDLVLTRTVYELNVALSTSARAAFETDDENGETNRHVSMSVENWNEMGKPETITVSIEPGNRLR